jgi:hypothetical protein
MATAGPVGHAISPRANVELLSRDVTQDELAVLHQSRPPLLGWFEQVSRILKKKQRKSSNQSRPPLEKGLLDPGKTNGELMPV